MNACARSMPQCCLFRVAFFGHVGRSGSALLVSSATPSGLLLISFSNPPAPCSSRTRRPQAAFSVPRPRGGDLGLTLHSRVATIEHEVAACEPLRRFVMPSGRGPAPIRAGDRARTRAGVGVVRDPASGPVEHTVIAKTFSHHGVATSRVRGLHSGRRATGQE